MTFINVFLLSSIFHFGLQLSYRTAGSLAGAQATVKCNPWFAIIVSGRFSRLAKSLAIHPLSYKCNRIRCAVFFAETAA
jgi:hypothetical protein